MSDQRTVRTVWAPITTHVSDWQKNWQEYLPPDGWFVDDILPVGVADRAGVVFVLRQIPGDTDAD